MNLGQLLHAFADDTKVHIALLLVAVDFLLGVLAAFKMKTFRLSYVSDFLRNDIAFKLVPYFVIYSAAIVAGGQEIVIPGLDLGIVAGAAYVALVASWVGSILSSVKDLGLPGLTPMVDGAENAAPPKD